MTAVTLTLTPEQALIIERALAGRLRGLEVASRRGMNAMSREANIQAQINVADTLYVVRDVLDPWPVEPDWELPTQSYHDLQAR